MEEEQHTLMQNERPTIFLDHDETLMWSRSKVTGSKEFMFQMPGGRQEASYTILRPGAIEFLEALKARGYRIAMLTQGWASFQLACLSQYGIQEYFEEIYGYTPDGGLTWEIEELPPQGKWLLVDNMEADDYYRTSIKRNWLRSGDFRQGVNYLTCEDFTGYDNGQYLTSLLPEIYRILG